MIIGVFRYRLEIMTKQYYSDKGADPYREALVMYFYSMPYMYDDMSLKKDE
jgi:hypothetical protein